MPNIIEVREAIMRATMALERIPDDPIKQVLIALVDAVAELADIKEEDAKV
jgi:hypothetical protein